MPSAGQVAWRNMMCGKETCKEKDELKTEDLVITDNGERRFFCMHIQ